MNQDSYLKYSPGKQSGVVLVLSLVLLAMLMLVVTTGLQVTTMQEKMAGNTRDKDLAFQAAESALRAAEASLNPPATYPVFSETGVGGFYKSDKQLQLALAANPGRTDIAAVINALRDVSSDSFWANHPYKTSTVNNLGNNIPAPVYIIQDMECRFKKSDGSPVNCPGSFPSNTFKISVKATGRSPNTVVVLQSIYCPSNCGE